MRIIISPAKKMNIDDGLPWKNLPVFLNNTEEVKNVVQGKTIKELKDIWKCNDALVELNYKRFENINLWNNLTPAVFSYEGIQYQHLAPNVLEEAALSYLEEHLRILSGFYGILKPFDGVTPYRLEMQAKLEVAGKKDLYAYWGDILYRELTKGDNVIFNLASKEYSKCIEKYIGKDDIFITCEFMVETKGKLVQKATLAKMARGEMVRYLAMNGIDNPEGAKEFNALGFVFNQELSSENKYVFVQQKVSVKEDF